MIGIYKIHNLNNNKVYVGSSKSLDKRKYQHFNLLKNNKHKNNHLQYAYNKYGKDSFVFHIIEECNIENLPTKEELWINKYNSYKRKYGYNLNKVEDSTHSFSQETKEIMKQSNKTKKKVYCYNLDGLLLHTFDSIKETSVRLALNRRQIQMVLNHKNRKYNNYYFSFDIFDYKPVSRAGLCTIRIDKYTLDDTYVCSFDSIKKASIAMNIAYTNMSRHLSQNKPKTVRGFKFKYQELESPSSPAQLV